MKCFMCKGSLEDKPTNFIADLGNCITIIKGVPSQVCRQCGEVSYCHEVAIHLESIISSMKNNMTEIIVATYKNEVA